MNIEISTVNGETVVTVEGCLDTLTSAEFKRAVDGIPAAATKVVFDFAALEFIASSALRVMVALGKRLDAVGGGIAITGANDVVRDVFEATGLCEVFELR